MNFDKLYINGEWVKPHSKEIIEVENPANEEIIGSVPAADEEDVNLAVAAAKEAFKTWQFSSMDTRIELINKLLEELKQQVDLMAETIVKELGCGISFAKNSHVLPYLDDIQNHLNIIGDYEFQEKHEDYIIFKEPVGVIGALTPWNYPLGQIIKKLTPALLAGNTLVLKPSQKTPLVAFLLTEAIDRANFPKGVFKIGRAHV